MTAETKPLRFWVGVYPQGLGTAVVLVKSTKDKVTSEDLLPHLSKYCGIISHSERIGVLGPFTLDEVTEIPEEKK